MRWGRKKRNSTLVSGFSTWARNLAWTKFMLSWIGILHVGLNGPTCFSFHVVILIPSHELGEHRLPTLCLLNFTNNFINFKKNWYFSCPLLILTYLVACPELNTYWLHIYLKQPTYLNLLPIDMALLIWTRLPTYPLPHKPTNVKRLDVVVVTCENCNMLVAVT